MIIVERNDPRHPGAMALLEQSHALMQSLFPPEENFFLDFDALAAHDIHFFTAREGDTIVGTGALKNCHDYGEIKSMFVADEARGKGVGDALLRQIEDQAREEKLDRIKLETGDALVAALKLYARNGYTTCDAFGPYATATRSIFMEKAL
ncbi:GNAT family N-acetyltransferase [Yoonia sp. 2307UL14-13]|uniref:GNAT family N-acetyltransferase n=1 Tax=Yoonia sp. 2307UL14-13 TaxID=3126506 RepID=UPI0030AD84F5